MDNETYIKAYKNVDNKKVIRRVLKLFREKYPNVMDKNTLSSCGMVALWRCINKHIDGKGNKFTTSLFNFCKWECQDAVRKLTSQNKTIQQFPEELDFVNTNKYYDDTEVLSLDPIVKMRFIEKKSVSRICRETGFSKTKINKAISNYLQKVKRDYHVK